MQIRGPRKPRNFYEKIPDGIEDNYVDETFLKGMAHKNSFPDLHYPKMIQNTVEIVHIINSVFLQIGLFHIIMNSLKESKIENTLIHSTTFINLIGYIVYSLLRMQPDLDTEPNQ